MARYRTVSHTEMSAFTAVLIESCWGEHIPVSSKWHIRSLLNYLQVYLTDWDYTNISQMQQVSQIWEGRPEDSYFKCFVSLSRFYWLSWLFDSNFSWIYSLADDQRTHFLLELLLQGEDFKWDNVSVWTQMYHLCEHIWQREKKIRKLHQSAPVKFPTSLKTVRAEWQTICAC